MRASLSGFNVERMAWIRSPSVSIWTTPAVFAVDAPYDGRQTVDVAKLRLRVRRESARGLRRA